MKLFSKLKKLVKSIQDSDWFYDQNKLGQLVEHPLLLVNLTVLALLLLGAGGYMLIEGWPFLDSLYMTVITMTTIGYGEVKTLSPMGRVFTIGLILIGVIIASYALTTVVELFTSQEFVGRIRSQRRQKRLEKINNHCIICGFGRLGRNLAKELKERNYPLIVIDIDEEAIDSCRNLDLPVLHGSAADEHILYEAGIERANSLVAAANSDAGNVFIVLTAKNIKADLQIIARCNADSSISKLETAGANAVISPYTTTGQRIAQMLIRPNVLSFLDGVIEFADHRMRLEEFIICQNSPLAGLTLQEARLKVAVLAVSKPGQTLLSHAMADTKLLPGAAVIVMGIDQELEKLAQIVKGQTVA